jgi:hypothetical protein
MNDLKEFIEKERAKREVENPQPVQSPASVRTSLLALKQAVDGFAPLEGNPLIENIKKVENVVERKDTNFIQPIPNNKPSTKSSVNNGMIYEEKDDKFTKELLLKTRQFITGSAGGNITPMINENTIYHPPVVEPDHRYNHINPSVLNVPGHNPSKNDVLSALKDTITDLYVKEKVESIIKEYLQTEEGKMLIKSIVIGLFKKK